MGMGSGGKGYAAGNTTTQQGWHPDQRADEAPVSPFVEGAADFVDWLLERNGEKE